MRWKWFMRRDGIIDEIANSDPLGPKTLYGSHSGAYSKGALDEPTLLLPEIRDLTPGQQSRTLVAPNQRRDRNGGGLHGPSLDAVDSKQDARSALRRLREVLEDRQLQAVHRGRMSAA